MFFQGFASNKEIKKYYLTSLSFNDEYLSIPETKLSEFTILEYKSNITCKIHSERFF
jgi:hypothetical protein